MAEAAAVASGLDDIGSELRGADNRERRVKLVVEETAGIRVTTERVAERRRDASIRCRTNKSGHAAKDLD